MGKIIIVVSDDVAQPLEILADSDVGNLLEAVVIHDMGRNDVRYNASPQSYTVSDKAVERFMDTRWVHKLCPICGSQEFEVTQIVEQQVTLDVVTGDESIDSTTPDQKVSGLKGVTSNNKDNKNPVYRCAVCHCELPELPNEKQFKDGYDYE